MFWKDYRKPENMSLSSLIYARLSSYLTLYLYQRIDLKVPCVGNMCKQEGRKFRVIHGLMSSRPGCVIGDCLNPCPTKRRSGGFISLTYWTLLLLFFTFNYMCWNINTGFFLKAQTYKDENYLKQYMKKKTRKKNYFWKNNAFSQKKPKKWNFE